MVPNASRLGRSQTFDAHVGKLIKVFEEVAASKSRRGPHVGKLVRRGVMH